MENGKTRVSRHNGRAGKNGVYNPKHNDRDFDVKHAENIDETRTAQNEYWDWKNGWRGHEENVNDCYPSFAEVEKEFYEERFGAYLAGQKARNKKTGHSKRDRTADDLLADKRWCPEETVYQIGKEGVCPDAAVLTSVVWDFIRWFESCFGSNVQVLDWALHLDEISPHIHMRQVFFVENDYGETEPKQEKALEKLEIPLPHPGEKPSRTNNRKAAFDAICREQLILICREHGINVEEEPIYGGRTYLEKNDYIIASQQEKLTELRQTTLEEEYRAEALTAVNQIMEQKLNGTVREADEKAEQLATITEQLRDTESELTQKQEALSDLDRLSRNLTEIVYNEAVDAVTEKAVSEAQVATVKLLNDTVKKADAEPGFLHSHDMTLLNKWFGYAVKSVKRAAEQLISKVRQALKKTEAAEEMKRVIAERAKPSVRAALAQYQSRVSPERSRKPYRGGDCR